MYSFGIQLFECVVCFYNKYEYKIQCFDTKDGSVEKSNSMKAGLFFQTDDIPVRTYLNIRRKPRKGFSFFCVSRLQYVSAV